MAYGDSGVEPNTEASPAEARSVSPGLGMFRQLVRFVVIGGGCALIDFGVYGLLLAGAGWVPWLSKSISFILGTSTAYVLNRKFTFSAASTGNATVKAGGFAAVYTATFFVNVGTNSLLLWVLPSFPFKYAVAVVIAQGLGTLLNFALLKWVVFRD